MKNPTGPTGPPTREKNEAEISTEIELSLTIFGQLKLGRPNMVKLKFPSKNRPNMVKLSLFLHIFSASLFWADGTTSFLY